MVQDIDGADFHIVLPAAPREVFAMLTVGENVCRWLAVAASMDARQGGRFHWATAEGVHIRGAVEQLVPDRRLALTWSATLATERVHTLPTRARIAFGLAPAGAETLLFVDESGWAWPQLDGTDFEGAEWQHYLGRLRTLVQTGDPDLDLW